MKKKIMISFVFVIVILISLLVGYQLGKNYTKEFKAQNEERIFVYYCHTTGPNVSYYDIWVDPMYNKYPLYGAAKGLKEEYNNTFKPGQIECEKVYQP